MDIYFGLHYTNNAFVDFESHRNIFLDRIVVGPEGLLSLLELYTGVYSGGLNVTDRQAAYYAAFRKTMAGGRNIFSDSWEKNGLGVSNECLKWRDTLRANGWRAQMKQPGQRLQVLAEVEKEFHAPSLGDRLEYLLPLLEARNPLPPRSRIFVASRDGKGLPPVVTRLLDTLKDAGTELVYETDRVLAPEGTNLSLVQSLLVNNASEDRLEKNDDSFRIWEFPTALDAARYVASRPKDSYNVYVTADGKLLDNVQRMLQQPTSGSDITDAHPQIAQLFKLGLGLFEYPLNIRNLISWLLMPLHPIRSGLRRELVKAMLATGGYNNQEYMEAIEGYRKKLGDEAGGGEQASAAVRKLDHALEIFIPAPKPAGVDKRTLLVFVNSLGAWCSMMSDLDDMDPGDSRQLAKVAGLCKSLAAIVEEEVDDAVIPFRQLEGWASALYAGTDFPVYACQAGSRWTVAASDLAEPADRILWTDCYNSPVAVPPTGFLNETEKSALLREGCQFWDDAAFNRAMMRDMLRPVLMCRRRLVLIVTDTTQGGVTAKHPLMIRLENAFPKTLSAVRERPDNGMAEKKAVTPVDNYSDGYEVRITKSRLVGMPASESYSSLDNLIQYPLDYVMERILKLRDRSSTEMDAVSTVKGNVAHAVIEALFRGSTPEIAAAVNDHFTETLQRLTEEKGAILLLQENLIEWQLFRVQLKECLDALLQIIQANGLTVEGREHRVGSPIGLLEDGASDPVVNGFVDMTLKNRKGEIFVFDFKWTSSRNYHKGLLEKNISIQLALYEHLVSLEYDRPVVATAYFTMPWHRLYTTSPRIAEGVNVEHVSPENDDALLEKIRNSYRYRREQLMQGRIENAEGAFLDEIPYAEEQAEKGLVPLSPDYDDKNIHSTNSFSAYTCFKYDKSL